ncbi:TetR/AcrR family transcriptional regulator [Leptospira kobayashii]|uniref:TetR/AcrR family transcriptional regulator n=1 Tax=Leptospira kobayashii TaxID=1917830 RepID=UPI001FA71235|nr:TetR family transcriptional regulator [Leptospira kobayashii]
MNPKIKLKKVGNQEMEKLKRKEKLPQTLPKDTEKSKKTKELIYNTAISLFQKDGYEKTTMRSISSQAGVSLGSAYYYFESKEDIVLQFYYFSQEDAKVQSEEFNKSTNDFKKRFKNIILYKIDSFAKYKNFVSVLAKNAGDPNHSISPFSEETKQIREDAIQIIREALESSNLKLKGEIVSLLPELLWLYQLGIVYFWISDSSKSSQRTKLIVDESLDMVFKLIQISKFPFFKTVIGSILKLYRLVKGN